MTRRKSISLNQFILPITSILRYIFWFSVVVIVVCIFMSKDCVLQNMLISLACSYLVAYGVYYLTVERPTELHRREQRYIKKDLLLEIRHKLIGITELLSMDKDLSVETVENDLESIKLDEWEGAIEKSDVACREILRLFASGLVFSEEELNLMYRTHQAVSSFVQFEYESRCKEVVVYCAIEIYKISESIDALCENIGADVQK